MHGQTKTVFGIALAAVFLGSSVGCTYRVALPPGTHDFVGFEDSRPGFVVAAEPYLSQSLNQKVFHSDLLAEGIFPIQLSITNVGNNVLAPATLPQLREPDGAVWSLVPARDVAKQIRRSAIWNGLMAKTPFLGLFAAPFGLVLAPVIGGTAESLASYSTTEANHDTADDLVGLALRQVTIAPGDTYRALVFFRVPPPARTINAFTSLVLTLPVEDVSTRHTLQATITIHTPIFYTRATTWDRQLAEGPRIAPALSPAPAEVVLAGLQVRHAAVDAVSHYEQAVADAQNGRWETALKALDYAIKADATQGEAFFGRGVLLARQGRFQDAATDLSRAIALGLHLTDIHNYRGYVYARQGQDDLAAEDWSIASTLSPNFPLPLYNRGMLSWVHSQPEQAKTDFLAACNLGFEPACFSLTDLEIHWPCCPPGTVPFVHRD